MTFYEIIINFLNYLNIKKIIITIKKTKKLKVFINYDKSPLISHPKKIIMIESNKNKSSFSKKTNPEKVKKRGKR